MNIVLLSHRGGNIGHDFMAAGFEAVLRDCFGESLRILHVEQHQPLSIYSSRNPVRLVDRFPYGRLTWLKWLLGSPLVFRALWPTARKFDARLAITCGGPNIVAGASRSAEMRLMFHHLTGALQHQGVPVIDAAVGACFPLEKVPSAIEDPRDVEFYARLFETCTRSTVRDRLAQSLWAQLGRAAPLIPCAALVSGKRLIAQGRPQTSEHVLVNFQEQGANEAWGQRIDSQAWVRTLSTVVTRLSRHRRVRFICHSEQERALASRTFPGFEVIRPTSISAYAEAVMGAIAFIASRIHMAIPMAGAGIGGVTVGTDTRLGAVDEIGLPTAYVKQVTAEWLEHTVEALIARKELEAQRLITLREGTALRYKQVILETLEQPQ